MRRLGTASVLGSVPAALINPMAELCLAGQPRSRRLLGSLVFGLLMRWPLEIHSAQVPPKCIGLEAAISTKKIQAQPAFEVGPRGT